MKKIYAIFWNVLLLLACQCLADMRMPPLITEYPSRIVIFKTDSTVTLPCVATGIPVPSYKWLKDGLDLEMSSRITMDPGVGTIRIAVANKYQDNGKYQCIAINQYGEALSLVVTLNQTELIFTSPTDPIGMTRIEGESLKLVLFEKLTSVPIAKYDWKIVDRVTNVGPVLQTNARIAVDQATGSLYFANILPSDQPTGSNIYKLDVTNSFEDATYGGAPYSLLVTANPNKENRPPARMVPEVEQYTQIAMKGSTTTIKCFFEGIPTPTVEWRSPSTGPPPNRIDCTQQSNTECLITAVEYSDEGVYTCTGRNSQGSVPVQITLLVQSVPTFATAPASSNATAGGSKSFICRADAVPPATITWYSNGNEISRDDPGSSRILISEDGTNLTVTQLCKTCEDPASGLQVFQCKMSNVHGDTYGSAYLNVIEPAVIYDKGDVQDVIVDPDIGEKLETNFTCRATVDELILDSLELAWWHGGQRLYNSHIHTINNNGENIYINLTGIPEDEIAEELGEYTCMASATGTSARAIYTFNIKGYVPPAPVTKSVADFWWLFLLIFLLLLILLLFICCVMYMQRNKGDDYPVDYYERDNGNDPEEECKDAAFHEHQRPIDMGGNLKGSRASLGGSSQNLDNRSKDSSLYGYENDLNISEEGSYIGQYNTNTYNRPILNVPSHAVSHA